MRGASAAGPGTSPLTTVGDIYGYDGADARIPVGADGETLIADSGEALGVRWGAATPGGALDAAYIVRTTDLSVANNTPTVVTAFDTGGDSGSLTNDLTNGVIEISTTGIYHVYAWVSYTTTWATGATIVTIYGIDQTMLPVNEVNDSQTGYAPLVDAAACEAIFVVTALPGPDDEFGMRVFQASGASKTAGDMQLAVVKLADLP